MVRNRPTQLTARLTAAWATNLGKAVAPGVARGGWRRRGHSNGA